MDAHEFMRLCDEFICMVDAYGATILFGNKRYNMNDQEAELHIRVRFTDNVPQPDVTITNADAG
jgi:hypothetical protein